MILCEWCTGENQWRHKACTLELAPKTYQCLKCKSKLVEDDYGSDDSDIENILAAEDNDDCDNSDDYDGACYD